jgi:hypothetical protein
MATDDDEKPMQKYRSTDYSCLYCRRHMGLGRGQIRLLMACRVTDEAGKQWELFLCPSCFERADEREMKREEKEARQNDWRQKAR